MDKQKKSNLISYLKQKLSSANLILFTGAGFSLGAKNKLGRTLPTSKELTEEIWHLIYHDINFDGSPLKDVFSVAKNKMSNKVCEYLKSRLTIDQESLGSEYETIINQPWQKDFCELWDFFKKHKTQFVTLREQFDTTTAAGEMMVFNLMNFAQFERKQTSERISANWLSRAKRGLWNGGSLPLGYD